VRVLLADDSGTIRAAVERVLRSAGFEQVIACADGQEAWETLCRRRDQEGTAPFDLVLSDIEMPRMDGLHLTSRIKEDETLCDTVVVLFSSLISDDNRKKGQAVGADAQVTKFQSDELIHAIDELLIGKGVMRPAGAES
jgi:two-component system chemotaxis response regulator CheV